MVGLEQPAALNMTATKPIAAKHFPITFRLLTDN
jgi:hypothetical protein